MIAIGSACGLGVLLIVMIIVCKVAKGCYSSPQQIHNMNEANSFVLTNRPYSVPQVSTHCISSRHIQSTDIDQQYSHKNNHTNPTNITNSKFKDSESIEDFSVFSYPVGENCIRNVCNREHSSALKSS